MSRHPSGTELMLAKEGELSPTRAARVAAHVNLCAACRTQILVMQNLMLTFIAARAAAIEPQIPPHGPSRALLATRLFACRKASRAHPWRWLRPWNMAWVLSRIVNRSPGVPAEITGKLRCGVWWG